MHRVRGVHLHQAEVKQALLIGGHGPAAKVRGWEPNCEEEEEWKVCKQVCHMVPSDQVTHEEPTCGGCQVGKVALAGSTWV